MTHQAPRLRQARRRGAALVEFVLVAPILVVLLLISMFLTDLLTARMKLQEAARFAVWEMTSRTLSDYGGGDHSGAFDLARTQTLEDALDRYDDLDGLTDGARLGMATEIDGVNFEMTQLEVDLGNAGYAPNTDDSGWSNRVNDRAGGGLSNAFDRFGFNRNGKVQVQVRGTVRSTLLPERYLQRSDGGWFETDFSAMSEVDLVNRYTMVVDGWDLGDGGDALMRNNRAGMHAQDDSTANGQHGLHRQVEKMTYLGDCEGIMQLGLAITIMSAVPGLGGLIPNKCVTAVVSHNYMRPASHMGWRGSSDCGYDTYPSDAIAGLNNLRNTSVLDAEKVRCYDTAPFRDTWTYGDSAYLKMFRARGDNFMGCENPQADNPAEAKTLYSDDENLTPVACLDGNDLE